MNTRTIRLDSEAYDQLKAEMREDESFSDTVKCITGDSDWQHGIGTYSGEQSNEFVNAVQRGCEATNYGLTQRQREVNATIHDDEG